MFFDGTNPVCDCLGAASLVLGHGLQKFLLEGEFDQLYKLNTFPLELFDDRPTPGSSRKGDWGYFRNDPRYLEKHNNGGYQGENVIKVGAFTYWGHPGGAKSSKSWKKELIEEYNSGLAEADQIDTIPGWDPAQVRFIDVSKISMDAFDLRN